VSSCDASRRLEPKRWLAGLRRATSGQLRALARLLRARDSGLVATVSPSQAPSRVVLTYDDLRATPDDGRRYELLEGELCVTPAPSTTHQRISRNLQFILHSHVSIRMLGEVLYAPVDVILADTIVVEPDLIFVASGRSALISERGIEGAPDLVVEILSPSTQQRDLGIKRQLYARYGVAHYWCVDPVARTLTELVLAGGEYTLRAVHGTSEVPMHSLLFPDLPIDLARVVSLRQPAV
jgi:Uma2 family endonuclease